MKTLIKQLINLLLFELICCDYRPPETILSPGLAFNTGNYADQVTKNHFQQTNLPLSDQVQQQQFFERGIVRVGKNWVQYKCFDLKLDFKTVFFFIF